MTVDAFLALWSLDPATCAYGDQPPPRRGLYRLSRDGDAIAAEVHWVDAAGEAHATSFTMTPDGAPRALPDGSSVVCRLDGDALVSEVLRDGTPVHTARRTLSADGRAMTVEQVVRGPGGAARISAVYRRVREDVKQVILYRRDLEMRKGKIAAQVAHASMKVLLDRDEGGWDRLVIPLDDVLASWTRARFAKIVLSVASEADLLQAHEEARRRGLPTALIVDAGRTEFHGVPTRTTVAIGPAPASDIDAITGPDGLVATKLA